MSYHSSAQEHHHDDDDDAAGRTRAPALLLDECWFFSNSLASNSSGKKKKKPPPHLPRSPSTSTGEKASASASAGPPPSRLGGRRLQRTPSLPSSSMTTMELPLPTSNSKDDDLVRLVHEDDGAGAAASGSGSGSGNQQPLEKEVDDDDLNWSSIYEGVLRTRMAEGSGNRSALRRAPSMPVPSSSAAGDGDGDGRRQTKSTPTRLLRHSHSTLGRHTPPPIATKQQQTSGLQVEDKKWKSWSDLESMEVQGFRDLGFVFDKEELRESLADVLPGLKNKQQQTTTSKSKSKSTTRRPYQNHQVVRRPALARVQSAAEMKDQLRMWAQAVACNVRQEC